MRKQPEFFGYPERDNQRIMIRGFNPDHFGLSHFQSSIENVIHRFSKEFSAMIDLEFDRSQIQFASNFFQRF